MNWYQSNNNSCFEMEDQRGETRGTTWGARVESYYETSSQEDRKDRSTP